MIGFAICASFCCHSKALHALSSLLEEGLDILPILSETAATTDTRFGSAEQFVQTVTTMTGHSPIRSIREAEPLGPAVPLDALILAPCTGNTLAKLALGITDSTVTMAAKAHLRADRPLLIALSTNDAMAGNLKNLAVMLEKKNVFFTPMLQDDPIHKPHSLVADFHLLPEAYHLMLKGQQYRPLFLTV